MTLQSWACSEFSRLGHPNAKEIVLYLLEIEDDSFMEEYLNAMLDPSDSNHKSFMKEFVKRRNEARSSLAPGFYRKADLEGNEKIEKLKIKIKEKEKSRLSNSQVMTQISVNSSSIKKKSKYVALYSEEGQNKDVILLPGRHKCDCQASKHKLINNCLKCGRIVCEQEGSGPCAFCQNLVVSKDEKEFINRGTKKSDALHNKLINSKKVTDNCDNGIDNKNSITLLTAIEHKNKLLEYDRTSEKRTKVYDDESDYFHTNSKWLNPSDKEKLNKLEEDMLQKKYDKNNKKVTIDLLGRTVIAADGTNMYHCDDPAVQEIIEKPDIYTFSENEKLMAKLDIERPIYVDANNSGQYISQKCREISLHSLHRLQDKELQEMCDEGMCLSMHQPWASLLIAGIKVHEGRMWYTSHRGRLWISSAAKVPTQLEIAHLEHTYKFLEKKDPINFPQHYPTGCLLGCVDIIDVLPQEEYRTQYPNGESDSPYVFICKNPQELKIKFPMKGQHKIYKLESKLHSTAKKSLKEFN